MLPAVAGKTWLTFSATLLRPPKLVSPNSEGFQHDWRSEEAVSWLVLFLNSHHSTADAYAAALFLFGLGRMGKEGREDPHIWMHNPYFFFSSASCSQTKAKDNWKENPIVSEKPNKKDRLIVSWNRTNHLKLWDRRILQFHTLLSLLGYKKINNSLNKASRKKDKHSWSHYISK